MSAALLQFPALEPSFREPSRAQASPPETPAWTRESLTGQLVELSGAGALTLVALLVLDAQRHGENSAWITLTDPFFPPDLAALGVDLAALPIIRARQAGELGRAADHLLRSGAFGLVVLDLARQGLAMPLQARLQHLARAKGAALVCLTDKDRAAESLSSLVSLRFEARVERRGQARFACVGEAIKDKRRGPGWSTTEVCHGPPGLR